MTEKKTTSIKAFSQTEAALATLRERYAGIEYEVATPEGMQLAKSGRKELRGYRTGLEKARKAEKEDALRLCQTIDSEARRITDELRALEDPIAKQIDDEQRRIDEEREAKIRAEEERVEKIKTRIEDIRCAVEPIAWDTPSRDIGIVITQIADLVIDESFAEFESPAEDAKVATLARLRDMRDAAKAREEDEARRKAEQEELERRRAEEESREEIRARIRRIRALANIGGDNSTGARIAIDNAKLIEIDETFGEFQDDARDAKAATLAKLRDIHKGAVEREQEEARRRADIEREAQAIAEERERQEKEQRRLDAEQAELDRWKAEREESERKRSRVDAVFYDAACRDLAESVLPNGQDEAIDSLAQNVQNAVEEWLEFDPLSPEYQITEAV